MGEIRITKNTKGLYNIKMYTSNSNIPLLKEDVYLDDITEELMRMEVTTHEK